MKKSWPVILVVFVIPLGVVFFLQIFGSNRFDVPVYYQSEWAIPTDCPSVDFPHQIPSVHRQPDRMSLVVFLDSGLLDEEARLQIIRVCEKSGNSPIHLLAYGTSEVEGTKCLELAIKSALELLDLKRCVFFMEPQKNSVLIDGRGNIRGYYDIKDREEVDRFAVEKDILIANEEYRSH